VAFDLSRSHRVALNDADFKELELLFKELEQESAGILADAAKNQDIIYERTLLMRFVGQGAETDLVIEPRPFNEFSKAHIRNLFDVEYKRLYGRTYQETPVELVTFKVRASLPKRPFSIPELKTKTHDIQACIKGERLAFSVIQKDYIPFTVYDRSKLFPKASISGPAIIEERESTIIIGEDAKAQVDNFGFVWISLIKLGEMKNDK
ncbi:MAG: hydantoinase/oxoprolinase family protein, partial [Proteobacteria bacterium]|nr:hydantoinase/oxoprolinase family protein [Pseudomonadota bacterium]